MSEMIERVARAIEEVVGCPDNSNGDFLKVAARAAIEAMREPTETMSRVAERPGDNAEGSPGSIAYWQADGIWKNMIDAALATEPVS